MTDIPKLEDLDPVETQEWLESIESVLKLHGPERAHFILERLIDYTRRSGAYLPFKPNTAYVNTIPTGREQEYPGNRALERRIEAFIRWNAMAMVVQANRISAEYGGHLSSYASSATLYEVGFNHFWRAPSDKHPGDMVFMQGHSSPGIYARAYLDGRLTEDQLRHFRQEAGGPGVGLSSYPHPWLMPDFWQFPTVSMGLGPMMAIFQARFIRYLEHRGLVKPSDRKVWAFLGDGEMDEPESMGALTMPVREGLDNLIFVINCNLQRLDGPVRGNGKIIQELEAAFLGAGAPQREDHPGARGGLSRRRRERHQGTVGLALGSTADARPSGPAATGDGGVRRRRVPERQGQGWGVHARAFFRQVPRAQGNGRQHVRRGDLAAESRRPRPPQGVCGLRRRREPQGAA